MQFNGEDIAPPMIIDGESESDRFTDRGVPLSYVHVTTVGTSFPERAKSISGT